MVPMNIYWDPTTVLARGCAFSGLCLYLLTIARLSCEKSSRRKVKKFQWEKPGYPLFGRKETALPARRIISFDVQLTDQRIAFEVWEVKVGHPSGEGHATET